MEDKTNPTPLAAIKKPKKTAKPGKGSKRTDAGRKKGRKPRADNCGHQAVDR